MRHNENNDETAGKRRQGRKGKKKQDFLIKLQGEGFELGGGLQAPSPGKRQKPKRRVLS